MTTFQSIKAKFNLVTSGAGSEITYDATLVDIETVSEDSEENLDYIWADFTLTQQTVNQIERTMIQINRVYNQQEISKLFKL